MVLDDLMLIPYVIPHTGASDRPRPPPGCGFVPSPSPDPPLGSASFDPTVRTLRQDPGPPHVNSEQLKSELTSSRFESRRLEGGRLDP